MRLASAPQREYAAVPAFADGPAVRVTSPQRFIGLAEPVPVIEPARTLGIVVSAVVGEYLATHADEYESIIAVPVYSPGELVRDAAGAITGARTLVEHRPVHPVACEASECLECSVRDCPRGEPMHYHHDGCPAY